MFFSRKRLLIASVYRHASEGRMRRLVTAVWVLSVEPIRQALKRLGVGWKRAKHGITSPDPEYVKKKGGGTG